MSYVSKDLRAAHEWMPAASSTIPPPRGLYLLFLLLILQLSMEAPRSLVPALPVVVTNVEGALALLVAGFAVWALRNRAARVRSLAAIRRASPRDPGFWIVLWLLALLASALLAPGLRVHALKFVLRSASIASLFWIARALHGRTSGGARRLQSTMGVIVGVGAMVALLGVMEGLPGHPLEPFLRVFRRVPTIAAGTLRLTATFTHANQTGAFLALVLPPAAALVMVARPRARLAWGASGALILWSLLGTMSRTAVAAGMASVVLLCVLARADRHGRARGAAFAVLAGIVIVCAARWSSDGSFRTRFGGFGSVAPFAASYQVPEEITMSPDQMIRVGVRVTNLGSLAWSSEGVLPVNVSYHVVRVGRVGRGDGGGDGGGRDDGAGGEGGDPKSGGADGNGEGHGADGNTVIFDGARTPLPGIIPPGGEVALAAWLRAPRESGRFVIAWDMVREKVTWFSWKGITPGLTRLNVVPADSIPWTGKDWWRDVPRSRMLSAAAKIDTMATWSETGRTLLWRQAARLFARRPLTGWGPDTFRLLYSKDLGPGHWDPRSHANDLYLELLATTGLLGLLAWLGFLATLLASGFAALRRARRDRRGHGDPPSTPSLLVAGLVLGVIVFILHGLLDSSLEFYGIMGLFWILAGALAARTPRRAKRIAALPGPA